MAGAPAARARRQAIDAERLPLHARRARSATPPRQGQEPRHDHGRVRRPARGEDNHTEVSTFLRKLDSEGVSPRSVNKNRQVLSAIFGFACRVDTHGLPSNPVAGTTKRREPPAGVLDFYEPEEVETIASAAADGSHRGAQPANLSADEIDMARTRGRTGRRAVPSRRLHRPAPRRADRAALGGRRLRHAADGRPSRRIRRRGGTDQELAGALPPTRRSRRRSPRTSAGSRRLHLTRGLRLLLAPRPAPRSLSRPSPLQGSPRRRRTAPLRFHALRHAAGSLIARHADARFVQEFLGHSRITTTERYMHAKARPEDLERVNLAFAVRPSNEQESSQSNPR